VTRKYSSISVEQLLDAPMGAGDTTLTLDDSAAVTALLGGVTLAGGNVDQFTIAVDPDTASEEIIFVRGTSGNQLTGLVRGQAGTSGISHSAGATVKHVLTSNDLDYYTTGVDSAITAAGTATLTNKDLSSSTNTFPSSLVTLTGTQTLTNKTLTTPVISSISNTGTVTLPTLTDTLVGRTTTDTLTNKTLTAPVVNLSINSQTAAYTLVAGDKSKVVIITSASTANVTVNSGIFAQGDVVYIIRNGAGACAVTAGAGVTVNGTPGLNLRAQYSSAALICTGTNTFILVGDLSA
jgi:hypothetical protein